ncbi:multiple sugar transport system substrate-binding protein [Nakamurella sp. UYEF19]|uniref:extracellular solute-binding protein n=1 Tax=Nakamurella sp. UYEF19 TaxID=1756392 RepID=UPI003399C10F
MKTRHLGRIGVAAAGLAVLMVTSACGGASNASPGATSAAPASTPSAASSTASAAGGSMASSPASAASSGASTGAPSSGGDAPSGSVAALPAAKLDVLIGSSGPAETEAVTAAAAAWGKSSGSTATVAAAQDLTQQLAQGFAAGKAPDVFYVGADQVANYAKAGNLLPYADSLTDAADFYPSLKQSFTYDGKFYCAPKDFSTLALFINTDMWKKAGLTDADIPKNWDGLAAVAKKLTAGKVPGLVMSPEHDRLDAFMVQNGSNLVDADGKPTVNDQKNIDALTFAKKLYTDGSMKWPKDLGAGWAGEAFGKSEAAMTIEGNWLLGSMTKDYPTTKYKVVELPTGPTGVKGTLSFTNCWGIAATTKSPDQAKALVQYLTGTDQQLAFAKAFGVIPSVQSAADAYLKANPNNAPFVNGVSYAKGVVSAPGITDVLTDFNSQLQGLSTGDPKAILDSVQDNLTSAMGS